MAADQRPRKPEPANMPKYLRWPPYPGYKFDHPHPPGGRCLTRCYCGRCPNYEPVRRPTPPTEGQPPQ